MTGDTRHDLRAIAAHFRTGGEVRGVRPFGTGHINDTYVCEVASGTSPRRFVLQRINHLVFTRPEQVMENVGRVTAHIRRKVEEAGGDPSRRTLSFVQSCEGALWHRNEAGNYWRMYVMVEQARTYDTVERPEHVKAASRAFGEFMRMLADLGGPPLHDTIPGFHDTKKRFRAFGDAVQRDRANRAASARDMIEFASRREGQAGVLVELLAQGKLPERVTHNDTKLNNVLIDERSGEGICVIDLDTVMPGSALYDFGDMVRVAANLGAEDERDLSKVGLNLERFEELTTGYLEGAGELLTDAEVERLAFSAGLITFEQGLRFLTDYLEGDPYYKVHRENHNLERCRAQFALLADMERRADRMESIVRSRVR
jgi:hypothetical protein